MKRISWVVLALAASVFSQENYQTWSAFKDITINTTSTGANVANPVADFPVLIRLTSANADVFSQAAAGGADIRFTTSNGATRLNHQKERWDSASQAAEFWVLVPSIAGNANTIIRMYWGKGSAADSSNGAAVFDTSKGFQAVWHMNSGGTGNENDATLNGFTATAGGTAPTSAAGNVGLARTFGGAGYLKCSSPSTASSVLNFAQGGSYTVSSWVNNTATPAQRVILGKSDNQYALQINGATPKAWEGVEFENATGWRAVSVTANQNAWTHVVFVRSGVAESLFVNGTLANGTPALSASTASRITNFDVVIGARPGTAPSGGTFTRFWSGLIDELEISSVARTSDWIKLGYATQVSGQTAVTLGPTSAGTTVPGAPTAVTGTPGNGQVGVSWTAPTSNGGATITAYTATSSPGSFTCTTTGGTSCTVTGLTNNTPYTFTVTATNSAGTGPASSPSPSVTPVAPVGVPTAPLNVTGTPGNAQVAVSWQTPSSNGGSAITGYTVTSNPDGKTCTTTGTLTCTVTTLTNGSPYTFTVTATNTAGTSIASAPSAAVTPAGAPLAPLNVTATAGNGQVAVSWTAASNGGSAILLYTATASPGGATCTSTSALTCTVTGLTNGTAYTFTVMATNANGNSPASLPSSSVTPIGPPTAPLNVTAIAGDGQAAVSWQAPVSNGGSAIILYTATASPGGATCTSTSALTCTITGLAANTYTFTVTATNATAGAGAASAASPSVTALQEFSAKNGFGIHRMGSSILFRIPTTSGAGISVMDIWGRTVWSQTVAAGVGELVWNGKSVAGASLRGIYLVRFSSFDPHAHKSVVERKIALMP